ncbi:MAG: hypothetical protein KGL39_36200 [Patescibacteria group bacterium]|nr:hypothetical protein [Patescibacteria group bacterium]
MAVGDVNSSERGSGARYNDGKADLSLIPMETLYDEARVWMYGEKKYARWNWMKGMDWSIPFACLMRHMAAWQRGEELDPESGLPHLAHAMCNLRMLTFYAEHYPEGDNRVPKEIYNKEEVNEDGKEFSAQASWNTRLSRRSQSYADQTQTSHPGANT